MQIRPLTTIDECRQVLGLEREIWGYADDQDVVPVPIFVATMRRGGILLGAFDGQALAGFAYSIPGFRDHRPLQWSHMLGVAERYRGRGLGLQLKAEQRRLTLAMGIDLIEWTFDPMQALNAHFNFVRLGVVVEDYEENVYGASSSALHRGAATDRMIARWWLRAPAVVRRLSEPAAGACDELDAAGALEVNSLQWGGDWPDPGDPALSLTSPKLLVVIPTGFSEMLAGASDRARAWRASTRAIFSAYLGRGYRAVDFRLDRAGRCGSYLLVRDATPSP